MKKIILAFGLLASAVFLTSCTVATGVSTYPSYSSTYYTSGYYVRPGWSSYNYYPGWRTYSGYRWNNRGWAGRTYWNRGWYGGRYNRGWYGRGHWRWR